MVDFHWVSNSYFFEFAAFRRACFQIFLIFCLVNVRSPSTMPFQFTDVHKIC